MRPEPGTNPEWDARVLSWQQKRDDITQRFRWRRHHNQRQATRYGQANGWHSSGRPPREEAPRPLPHAVGAIKDWRYYRRAASGLQTGGAIWTDLYNAPLRNVKKLGLVNKKVLQEDIHGLEHICAIVAREQDAQQADHDRIKAQAEEIRADFVMTLRENRDKPGGVDYTRRIMGKEVLPPTLLGPPRVTARTERLSHGHKGVAARRALFERLGCQDMKGLLVTDRGLAEHMHTLAALVDVELPKNKFIPRKDSSFQGPRVKT